MLVKPLTQVAETYQQVDTLLAAYYGGMADIPAPNVFQRIAMHALTTRLRDILPQGIKRSSAHHSPVVNNTWLDFDLLERLGS